MKQLHFDHGREYLSDDFTRHLKLEGTKWKLTIHDTPEYNCVVVHLN